MIVDKAVRICLLSRSVYLKNERLSISFKTLILFMADLFSSSLSAELTSLFIFLHSQLYLAFSPSWSLDFISPHHSLWLEWRTQVRIKEKGRNQLLQVIHHLNLGLKFNFWTLRVNKKGIPFSLNIREVLEGRYLDLMFLESTNFPYV